MARRKITLEELLRAKQKEPYEDQAAFILARVGEKRLIPIPRSGTNGKKPALCLRYWEVLPETDRQDLREELLYQTVPGIRVDYYLSHLEVYEKERADVRRLDAWLREQKNQAPLPISDLTKSLDTALGLFISERPYRRSDFCYSDAFFRLL